MIPDSPAVPFHDIRLDLPIRILLRRATGLGDVVLTTGIVRELFKLYRGQALIDVATAFPAVFANNPHVRHTITPSSPISLDDYDRIINLDMAYERNRQLHIAVAYAAVAFGNQDMPLNPQLFPDPASVSRVSSLRAQVGKPYIVLHARNARFFPARNFSANFWQSVVEGLLEDEICSVVTIGSDSDYRFSGPRIHNLHNQLGLQETLLLIEHAEMFIGVDSGMLHVAACTQTPIVGLFTQARHEYRQPLGRDAPFIPLTPLLPCIGCIHDPNTTASQAATGCPLNDLSCVTGIPALAVIDAARKIRPKNQSS